MKIRNIIIFFFIFFPLAVLGGNWWGGSDPGRDFERCMNNCEERCRDAGGDDDYDYGYFPPSHDCTGRIVSCGPWGPCKRSFTSGVQLRDCKNDCGATIPGGFDPITVRDCPGLNSW